jgi:23S rRNA (uracil1939-C5)-methyltransferase
LAEEWTIEKLVPGGAGFARRPDGSAAFARGVAPGERIRVTEFERRKGYSEASTFELLTRSDARVEPGCPVASRCGGCDWLHLSYPAQLASKAALLSEALRRTGGFHELAPIEVLPSALELGYRQRVRLHLDTAGRVGFFEARSHRLIEIEHCPATRVELDQALGDFTRAARRFPAAAARFERAELSLSPFPPERAAFLWPREKGSDLGRGEPFLAELSPTFAVAVEGRPAGFTQRFPLPGELELEVLPGAFVQVNWEVNLALVNAVVKRALERGLSQFLDLYAGAGNFGLALAGAGLSGVCVEAHPAAAASARRSLARFGLEGVRVICDDIARALPQLAADASGVELALLDPPRTGASESLRPLRALAPRHIAYVSCDPVTLARDLRVLVDSGYALTSIQGFDMFPGTHHVEALAWGGGGGGRGGRGPATLIILVAVARVAVLK